MKYFVILPAFAAVRAFAANFMAPDALELKALLPPPPAADSPVTRAELETVRQLQAARTPEQAARCRQIEGEDIFLFGSDVLGSWFNAARLPRTAAFFAQVREDFIPVNRAAKALWPRRRPPFVDPRISPCVELTDSGSYPSGHGIQAALWAALLAEIFPEQAADFQRRAEETMRYKLISGVHYPTDLVAGQAVGGVVAREILRSPAAQAALAGLRVEAGLQRPH